MSTTTPTTAEAKGTNIQIPWLTLVIRADPDFARARHREVEYETSSARVFTADPTARGAYNHPLLGFQLGAFQSGAFQQT